MRDAVARNVAIAKRAALPASARFGPRRHATRMPRNDVAKTLVAMIARLVFGAPKNVCWKVEANVRTSASRKRMPICCSRVPKLAVVAVLAMGRKTPAVLPEECSSATSSRLPRVLL